MNIEEIDKWLDNEYGVSYTRLEELHDFYFERYTNLKSILTELEEWLENNWKSTQDIWYVKIINKIQELKEKYK